MNSINVIRGDGELADFIAAVLRGGWAAMDTEFLRERTYTPELCLIQIANQDLAACVDPLAVNDLSPLGALLDDPAVVKIFHSCRQDLEAIDTRTTIHADNLYDTQLAAAFCGYGDQVSYAALVESVCAVHLPKTHTRTDWSRRPLSGAQLEYALDDVKYLPALHQELHRRLEQKGRVEWHKDECIRAMDPANYRFAPEQAWLRLKGIERMDNAARACARKLAVWREQKAHHRNLPRGWILPTPVLLQICRHRPDSVAKLAQIKEIAPGTVKHAGHELIALITQTEPHDDSVTEPPGPTPPLTPEQRRQVREIMDWLDRHAKQAELSRSLIANRQEIENFVRGNTNSPLFKGWRKHLIGDELMARYS